MNNDTKDTSRTGADSVLQTASSDPDLKHTPAASADDTIDFKAIMQNYLRHWYWFAISIVVCMGMGWFYMHKKSPTYQVTSTIMLNQGDEESSNLSSISALASQFGFGASSGGSNANIYDELTRLDAEQLLRSVVAECRLNQTSWNETSFFKPKAWYYDDAPFSIKAPQELLDTIGVATIFNIKTGEGKGFDLTIEQGPDYKSEKHIERLPYTARTPWGTFMIDTTSFYRPGQKLDFHSMILGTPLAVSDLRSCLSIQEVDKKANGIYLTIETNNIPRAEATLNTLVKLYSDGRFEQKLKARKEALEFIEGRLLRLYNELEDSENQIENFKRDNKIVDATAEAEYIFARKGAIEGTAAETRTQLEIFRMLRDMLSSSSTKYSLLPFASGGVEDSSLATAVESYNELVLKRMELESGVKGQSATLDRLTGQIDALRSNILTTLAREIQAKEIALAAVSRQEGGSEKRINEIPYMEKRLTQLYRDREVKNAIYAFLLQKREEAEIAVQQVQPINEVIDEAYALPKPVAPKGMVVYGVAFVAAVLMPLFLVKALCKPSRQRRQRRLRLPFFRDK